ncbi:MAG: hypothetical protein AB1744_03345, partial [Candidatus Zixiibacteriota bacterium]
MKIAECNIFRFSLPLRMSLESKHGTLTGREGIIIELSDDAGHVGLGEVSPLAGFSLESLDEAIAQLRR